MGREALNNFIYKLYTVRIAKKLTRMNFMQYVKHEFTTKKNSFFKYITIEIRYSDLSQPKRANDSIHLNKHIDYVKHNVFNGTKVKILTFIRKTHFHELRNTVQLSFTRKLQL